MDISNSSEVYVLAIENNMERQVVFRSSPDLLNMGFRLRGPLLLVILAFVEWQD